MNKFIFLLVVCRSFTYTKHDDVLISKHDDFQMESPNSIMRLDRLIEKRTRYNRVIDSGQKYHISHHSSDFFYFDWIKLRISICLIFHRKQPIVLTFIWLSPFSIHFFCHSLHTPTKKRYDQNNWKSVSRILSFWLSVSVRTC